MEISLLTQVSIFDKELFRPMSNTKFDLHRGVVLVLRYLAPAVVSSLPSRLVSYSPESMLSIMQCY